MGHAFLLEAVRQNGFQRRKATGSRYESFYRRLARNNRLEEEKLTYLLIPYHDQDNDNEGEFISMVKENWNLNVLYSGLDDPQCEKNIAF